MSDSSSTHMPTNPDPGAMLAVHRAGIARLTRQVDEHDRALAAGALERTQMRAEVKALTEKVGEQTDEIRKLRHAVAALTQRFDSLDLVRGFEAKQLAREAEQKARDADASRPIQVAPTGPNPVVAEEIRTRTRLWAALGSLALAASAAIGWLLAKFSGGPPPSP